MKYLPSFKFILLTLTLICVTSCTKDDLSNDVDISTIVVKLKSVTGELDKVFIDLEDVQLKIKENGNTQTTWVSLNAINQGTYNAYDLREDSELLLVEGFNLKSTFIYEIRLVLGNNNFIDINNTLHSLDVTDIGNATPSNLVRTELIPNRRYEFVIELDIDGSVRINEDDNMMILDPKLYTEIRQFQY